MWATLFRTGNDYDDNLVSIRMKVVIFTTAIYIKQTDLENNQL